MLRRNLRLKTAAIVTLAGLLILAGVAVGVVRLVDTAVPGYRNELAAWVGDTLGQPMTIGSMELSWGWSGPILRLADVALLDDDGAQPVLELEAMALQFAFLDLVRGRTMPEGVALVGPSLTVERGADGRFRLRGLTAGAGGDFDPGEAGRWLQRVDRIRVLRGQLRLTAPELSAPVTLTDLTAALSNRGPRHRLNADADVAGAPGGRLTAQLFVLGDLAQPATTEVHAYLRADQASAPRLLSLLGQGRHGLHGGDSDLEVWADWNDGRFRGARASARVGALRGEAGDIGAPPLVAPLTVNASARRVDDTVRLRLDGLESRAFEAPEAGGELTVIPGDWTVEGALTGLPAALAATAARLWRPGALDTLAAEGRLPELAVQRDGDGWRLGAAFADLRITDRDRGFALGRLDGRVEITPEGGLLRLDGGEGALAWDRYVNGSLPLSGLGGEIAWHPGETGRVIEIADLRLSAAGTAVEGGGRLRLAPEAVPEADLRFALRTDDIGPVLDYIPQAEDLPNPRLRHWLPDAIPAGRIESASVRLKGPLDRFPFADGGGTFRVEAEGEGLTLAYKPDWPVLENIRGTFALEGDTLDIRARSGRMLGVTLGPVHAHIPNVREPILAVDGGLDSADAAAMMRFLPNSPLADKFGRLAEVLEVSGRAGLALDLSVPLKPGLGELALNGRINLAGVALDHEVLPRPIRDIRGPLRFDRKGLYADGLHASFAGMPVVAGLAPAEGDRLAIDANALMTLPEQAESLGGLLPPALLARARGSTSWRARLAVSPGGRVSDLRLSSDLTDMALDLPAPLGKPAAPAAPIDLSLAADRSRATLDYGDRLRAELRLADGRPSAVNLLFGADPRPAPDGPGLWLGGHLPVVDVHAWQELLDALGGDGPSLGLRGAELEAEGLRLTGRRIGPVAVSLAPMTARDGWLARITGEGASGTVQWRIGPGSDQVLADFDHLAMQAVDKAEAAKDDGAALMPGGEDGGPPVDPAALPTFDATVADLRLGGSSLGRLQVTAVAEPGGLSLETLSLTGSDVDLTGGGRWVRRDGVSEAAADMSLTGAGIDRVLQALGYTATLRAQDSNIRADLRFAPRADGLRLAALNGELSVSFQKGTLVTLEPGAGRVLGLLNFYALPRRLLLDFRDVVGEGMAFDSLSGDFRIEDGNAYTDNLRINTPSATIRIRGRVGLAARDYDQRVTIVPKTGSAAAIAGTVLGGPAVGAAVFLAQRLLRKPIADISSLTYHLTGSWKDPQIEPIEQTDTAG